MVVSMHHLQVTKKMSEQNKDDDFSSEGVFIFLGIELLHIVLKSLRTVYNFICVNISPL